MRAAPDRGVVRSLAGCAEEELPAVGPLWRVQPAVLRGWATLFELLRDSNGDGRLTFPLERNLRFAASVGPIDRRTDQATPVLATSTGTRLQLTEPAQPLSPARVYLPSRGQLVDSKGRPVPWPSGCGEPLVLEGVATSILQCDGASALWPLAGLPRRLAVAIAELAGRPRPDEHGRAWVFARAAEGWGRLALDDGEFVPAGRGAAALGRGWLTVAGPDELAVVELGRGRRAVIRERAADVAPLAARVGANWLVLDPIGCRAVAVPARPLFVSDGGCAFFSFGSDGVLERGPWIRRCPR